MTNARRPRSLRSRLLTAVLLCWVLPVLIVMALAGYLLGVSYESAAQQEFDTRARNAMEQLEMRMDAVFEASKTVSYDGVVRNSYRLYERDGDSAALYRTVTEYLSQNFTRDERIDAAFLSFWELGEVRPYAASRGDLGIRAQRQYRETIEADVLERMREIDTGILLLEYDGDLYVARNLLDSRFRPYATVVLLCDREQLFQSLEPVRQISEPSLLLDDRLLVEGDSLRSVERAPDTGDALRYEGGVAGHRFVLTAAIAPLDVWHDVPQIRTAAGFVALLALPLLLVVFYLFRRQVTHPVEILVEANNRLESGERGYTIDAKADSLEFQRLYAHFNTMSAELKNQFERSYLEQQALQQARVKALQLQINPHFLNNTLEIINWEARLADDERVSAMIEALSTMMDGALGRDGRSQIHLREELSYVDAYLYIIRERLGERLEVRKEIDEDVLDTMVPRLILQPLAENAVEHDITPRRGGLLTLRARREGERLVLEVEHDGSMSAEDRAAIEEMLASPVEDTEISGQVGLRNVRQRLTLLYGEKGKLSLSQSGPDRILARVSFPAVD